MDQYTTIRTLGRGAFATVHQVRNKTTGDDFVVKVFHTPMDELGQRERDEILQEIKLLAHLRHDGVVHFVDNFVENGTMHIIMEYASAGTLQNSLVDADGEYFDEHQLWEWLVQMVDALRYVHSRGILHRDLKPANIMLSGPQGRTIKVGDFGIAKILGKEEQAATIVGTPHYLSPEVCSGQRYDVKSDVWGLGCVLYELAALRRPFEGSNLPQIIFAIMRNRPEPLPAHYSKEMRAMVALLLQPNPADRPSLGQIWRMPLVSAHLKRWKATRRRLRGELPTPQSTRGVSGGATSAGGSPYVGNAGVPPSPDAAHASDVADASRGTTPTAQPSVLTGRGSQSGSIPATSNAFSELATPRSGRGDSGTPAAAAAAAAAAVSAAAGGKVIMAEESAELLSELKQIKGESATLGLTAAALKHADAKLKAAAQQRRIARARASAAPGMLRGLPEDVEIDAMVIGTGASGINGTGLIGDGRSSIGGVPVIHVDDESDDGSVDEEEDRGAVAVLSRLWRVQRRLVSPGSRAGGALWEGLGRAWAELGFFDQAIDAYRRCLKRSGSTASVGAMEQLGNLLVRRAQQVWSLARLGDVDKAASLMEAAGSQRLKRAVQSFVRRQGRSQLGRYESADARLTGGGGTPPVPAGGIFARQTGGTSSPQPPVAAAVSGRGSQAGFIAPARDPIISDDSQSAGRAAGSTRSSQPRRASADATRPDVRSGSRATDAVPSLSSQVDGQTAGSPGTSPRSPIAGASSPITSTTNAAGGSIGEISAGVIAQGSARLLNDSSRAVNAPALPPAEWRTLADELMMEGLGLLERLCLLVPAAESKSLLGSAYKRRAWTGLGAEPEQDLRHAAHAYEEAHELEMEQLADAGMGWGSDAAGGPVPSPYARLNQLTLELLACDGQPEQLRSLRAAVREAEGWARQRVEDAPADVWGWLQLIDARFLRALLGDGKVDEEEVASQYHTQFRFGASQRVRSSVLDQMAFLVEVIDRRLSAQSERLASLPGMVELVRAGSHGSVSSAGRGASPALGGAVSTPPDVIGLGELPSSGLGIVGASSNASGADASSLAHPVVVAHQRSRQFMILVKSKVVAMVERLTVDPAEEEAAERARLEGDGNVASTPGSSRGGAAAADGRAAGGADGAGGAPHDAEDAVRDLYATVLNQTPAGAVADADTGKRRQDAREVLQQGPASSVIDSAVPSGGVFADQSKSGPRTRPKDLGLSVVTRGASDEADAGGLPGVTHGPGRTGGSPRGSNASLTGRSDGSVTGRSHRGGRLGILTPDGLNEANVAASALGHATSAQDSASHMALSVASRSRLDQPGLPSLRSGQHSSNTQTGSAGRASEGGAGGRQQGVLSGGGAGGIGGIGSDAKRLHPRGPASGETHTGIGQRVTAAASSAVRDDGSVLVVGGGPPLDGSQMLTSPLSGGIAISHTMPMGSLSPATKVAQATATGSDSAGRSSSADTATGSGRPSVTTRNQSSATSRASKTGSRSQAPELGSLPEDRAISHSPSSNQHRSHPLPMINSGEQLSLGTQSDISTQPVPARHNPFGRGRAKNMAPPSKSEVDSAMSGLPAPPVKQTNPFARGSRHRKPPTSQALLAMGAPSKLPQQASQPVSTVTPTSTFPSPPTEAAEVVGGGTSSSKVTVSATSSATNLKGDPTDAPTPAASSSAAGASDDSLPSHASAIDASHASAIDASRASAMLSKAGVQQQTGLSASHAVPSKGQSTASVAPMPTDATAGSVIVKPSGGGCCTVM